MTSLLETAVASVLIAVATAQHPGDGISKQTYSATDPQAAFTWFATYLPIHCGDPTAMCNSTSDCGQKGRSNICSEDDLESCSGNAMNTFMFHMVNTSVRPMGTVATVQQVEAAFDEKMAHAFSKKSYDAFMDYSVAFWASDLDLYIKKLKGDRVPFLLLSWQDDTATPYYSLILHGPHTQVVVELVSSARPSLASDAEITAHQSLRWHSGLFSDMGVSTSVASNRLRPLAVSKATSDLESIVDFYTGALFATLTKKASNPDGSRVVFFNPGFSSSSGKMQVRFVERAASATKGTMSVKDLERIKFSGHDVVHDDAGNSTANTICGFDKWYDNHYGIDGAEPSLDKYKAAFDERNWTYYQAWGGGMGPENMYVVDPTGDSVQLDSMWENSPPAGVVGDALGTMCGQGNCRGRPVPSTCSAALEEACHALALGKAACATCVYDAENYRALRSASCKNADLVLYCVGS